MKRTTRSNGSTPTDVFARSSVALRSPETSRAIARVASRLVALFACVASGGRAQASNAIQTTAAQLPTIVVVSFDALGDGFLDRDTLPNFRRLVAEGVRAPFRPQFPSKTFPNHYSMATGLTPAEHGIVV